MVTYSDLAEFLSWVGADGIVLCGEDVRGYFRINESDSDLIERFLSDERAS